MTEQSLFQCMTGVHILNSTLKGCQTSKATTTFDSPRMSLVEFTSKRVTCLPNSRWCFWRIPQSFLRPHVFQPKWIQRGWAKIANGIFSVRSGSSASQEQKNWLHQLLRNKFNNDDFSTQQRLKTALTRHHKTAPLGATTSMKVLINSTKSHLTKINLILSKIWGESFYSERSWSDLFSIFCARVTKLRKFRNTAIVTNCKAFKNQFTLGPIFSRSFTQAPRNYRERKDVRHSVQTAKHPKSFQSKITPSDIFSSIFCARGKIIKKERPLLLQTAKHFQVISK